MLCAFLTDGAWLINEVVTLVTTKRTKQDEIDQMCRRTTLWLEVSTSFDSNNNLLAPKVFVNSEFSHMVTAPNIIHKCRNLSTFINVIVFGIISILNLQDKGSFYMENAFYIDAAMCLLTSLTHFAFPQHILKLVVSVNS